jgi:hypothetical protein
VPPPDRTLALDGGSRVLEGSLLLVELSLSLLSRAPLLAKLLLHCGERRGLLL